MIERPPRCLCGHPYWSHWLTSQDEEGELWCMRCECREYKAAALSAGPYGTPVLTD